MAKIQFKSLENKKIGILGLGIENIELINCILAEDLHCTITICDGRSQDELGEKFTTLSKRKIISWRIGEHFSQNLDGFDIVFRSPGWPYFDPEIIKAKKLGTIVTSPIRYFLELCPSKNTIGVTGTKGKGTTASLICAIIEKSGRRVWLGGNIGIAPFGFLEKIKKNDYVILELSSFQLEDADISPHVAVMTNFTREHQKAADPFNPNHHKSMISYWNAKANIFRWQKKEDRTFINIKLKNKKLGAGKGKKVFFRKSDLTTKLPGKHNMENIAAAIEVAKFLRIPKKIIDEAISEFKGLEHRIEFVRELDEVRYYNDSFATIPESTIIALKSFKKPIILIAGGSDKGSNFKELSYHIKKRVKFLILIKGAALPRIQEELEKVEYHKKNILIVSTMKEAVWASVKQADKNNIVLLSPACASFGVFKNYKERGYLFKEEVNKL